MKCEIKRYQTARDRLLDDLREEGLRAVSYEAPNAEGDDGGDL